MIKFLNLHDFLNKKAKAHFHYSYGFKAQFYDL